jgi:predicted phosphate transport protein (TIGR00153 family)
LFQTLTKLFARSPFGPLSEHLVQVKECVDHVPKMLEAACTGDQEKLAMLVREVYRHEHQADEIKNRIRDDLPKSVLLPVNRGDFLRLLHNQDAAADAAEDVGVVLSLRPLVTPDALCDALKPFLEKVIETFEGFFNVGIEIGKVVGKSASKEETKSVHVAIDRVGHLEWETDRMAQDFLRRIFEAEAAGDISTIDVIIWMKVSENLGGIADASERTANHIRLMIASS